MSNATSPLARELHSALSGSDVTVDVLAERTKVPRMTILHFLDEPVSAVLPERVYLRGHLGVLAEELGADRGRLEAAFDAAHPADVSEKTPVPQRARFRAQSFAVTATLGGVALLSVVAAFVSALS
ncbi:MAG: hypothetical protein AAFU79_20220 [Myxococcota bacterium]